MVDDPFPGVGWDSLHQAGSYYLQWGLKSQDGPSGILGAFFFFTDTSYRGFFRL